MNKTVCIVGSHRDTRELAPWDRPDTDFWVFNEAANQSVKDDHGNLYKWVKKCNGVFQMHKPVVYRNPNNRTDANHWQWLQEPHDFPIWMLEADLLVPASVKYPLDEICDSLLARFLQGHEFVPRKYFTSTVAYSLALAIHKGYERILIYGIEMASDTEYHYQRDCVAFWIGLALGRGIKVDMYSGDAIFARPLYGYEGALAIEPEEFKRHADELTELRKLTYVRLRGIEDALETVYMSANGSLPETIGKYLDTQMELGRVDGALSETQRYLYKIDAMIAETGKAFIDRNEYEGAAAATRDDVSKWQAEIHRTAGRLDYVLLVWDKTRNPTALDQVKQFVKAHGEAGYKSGRVIGIYKENERLAMQLDALQHAFGGATAVSSLQPTPV